MSGALLMFKSWMQDIECTIKDHNLNNDEALQLIKEFSKGCARNNINFYLEVTDKPSVDGLFKNLRQVFSSGEDAQQMLAEFYSCTQNQKESVKEFGESLLQIARKIMMAKPEVKVNINNMLKAHFAEGSLPSSYGKRNDPLTSNFKLCHLQVRGSENIRTKCQTAQYHHKQVRNIRH